MSQINYKDKYLQLKQRFMESVDVAFRLGFEQGTQAAQQQQMQQQQQQMADQQAAQAQMAANGGQPGQPGQDDGMGGDPSQGGDPTQGGAQIQDDSRGVGQQAQGANGGMGGSELDQHIGELEGLMAKSEYGSEQWEVLHKQITIFKSAKLQADMKKNEALIKSIGENLRKPLKINPRANHNMAHPAKAALTLQHTIVNGIMDTWEKEEKGLPTEISKILASEGLTKKE